MWEPCFKFNIIHNNIHNICFIFFIRIIITLITILTENYRKYNRNLLFFETQHFFTRENPILISQHPIWKNTYNQLKKHYPPNQNPNWNSNSTSPSSGDQNTTSTSTRTFEKNSHTHTHVSRTSVGNYPVRAANENGNSTFIGLNNSFGMGNG